jgi:hypothetical protein
LVRWSVGQLDDPLIHRGGDEFGIDGFAASFAAPFSSNFEHMGSECSATEG